MAPGCGSAQGDEEKEEEEEKVMEVEAKFSIPDRASFDQLCQLRELAGFRLEPAGVKKVRDRYLDADDRAILRAGYACRVRHKGHRPVRRFAPDGDAKPVKVETYVATLKGLGGADSDSGIHQRVEYEVPVVGADPATWPESPARDLALQLSGGRPLRELFTLSQERHIRLLYDDASEGARLVAELSLDVVAPGGHGSRPYYELEIELLDQGSESDLHILTNDLRTAWGLRPELRSKFERGLVLIDGGN
jgi:inorganic triphosphatase YgiF